MCIVIFICIVFRKHGSKSMYQFYIPSMSRPAEGPDNSRLTMTGDGGAHLRLTDNV